MDSELSSPGPRTFQGIMQIPCDITLENALLFEPERPIRIEENIAEMLFLQNNINLKGYNSNQIYCSNQAEINLLDFQR